MTPVLTVRSKGQPISIYAISTGKVTMKTKAHSARYKPFPMRVLDIMRDKKFTQWFPIYVWVIEHPEGVFIIDTGITTRVNEPGIYDKAGFVRKWFANTQVKTDIKQEEEIDNQLHQIGLDEKQIKSVILTHSHMDHVDGLKYFGNTEIIVNKKEWEKRDLPYMIPGGLNIKQVELNDTIDNGLVNGHYITKTKDLFLIATPGHSVGHCSVVLKTDDVDIIFAGDVVYEQYQLHQDIHIGVNESQKSSEQTFKKLKTYMRKHPSVFLPSHDPLSLKRLVNKETF